MEEINIIKKTQNIIIKLSDEEKSDITKVVKILKKLYNISVNNDLYYMNLPDNQMISSDLDDTIELLELLIADSINFSCD